MSFRHLVSGFALFGLMFLISPVFSGDNPPEVSEAETTAVCFIPGGPAAPADYLSGTMKGFDAIQDALTIKFRKTGLLSKSLSVEVSFLEPAITTQVLADSKGKLDWLRPAVVKNPESQYGFSLEVRSDKKDCFKEGGLMFTVQVQSGGKTTQAPPPVFQWKNEKPKSRTVSVNDPYRVVASGFSVSFNPHSTFYSNDAVLYTGVPLSKSVEKLTLTALDCFGKEHRFVYNFKYNELPK